MLLSQENPRAMVPLSAPLAAGASELRIFNSRSRPSLNKQGVAAG